VQREPSAERRLIPLAANINDVVAMTMFVRRRQWGRLAAPA
jgi:hypothetical protein